MKVNLDVLKEERENVIVRVAAYQQQLTSCYNKKAITIVRAAAYHQQLASYNNKTIVRVAAYQLDSK
ncbi:unnamed protein product [Prunus armeniaca]